MSQMPSNPIVLFDGVCNLCNASVDFILRFDKKKQLKFAPLQGQAGQELRKRYDLNERLYSVVLIQEGKTYDKSTAALEIARHLVFPWKCFYVLIYFPQRWRDRFYAYIARNRYRWFGKRDTCRIPSPEESERFLA